MIYGPTLAAHFPVTWEFGLVNAGAERFARELFDWRKELGQSPEISRLSAGLAGALAALEPLSPQPRRNLIVELTGGWTAYFASGISGTDPGPVVRYFSRRMNVRTMRVCSRVQKGKHRGAIWELYTTEKPANDGLGTMRRAVAAFVEGTRWKFDQLGEPFDFENTRQYEAQKIPDRFTAEMMRDYVRTFGVNPFSDDSYVIDAGHPAVLMTRVVPRADMKDYTYAQVMAGDPWK